MKWKRDRDEPTTWTTPLVVELTDLPGIVTAARQVADMGDPLDMLILNAGIMQLPELQLSNGVERQFAVNHVGHFLLAMRLLDQVTAADAGRVYGDEKEPASPAARAFAELAKSVLELARPRRGGRA